MKYEIVLLFIVGTVFSFLAYLGESLENNKYVGRSAKVVFTIILSKSVLGGTLAVIVYFGLSEATAWNDYLKVGCSATVAILAEHSKKLLILFASIKIGVKNDL